MPGNGPHPRKRLSIGKRSFAAVKTGKARPLAKTLYAYPEHLRQRGPLTAKGAATPVFKKSPRFFCVRYRHDYSSITKCCIAK
jgi:hypothetical protein